MSSYQVALRRTDNLGSIASCKAAQIGCDTSVAGSNDAFNPAELFITAIAACMLKGIERTIPILKFRLDEVEIRITATRQDSPPRLIGVEYDIVLDTTESDHRLDLMHRNIQKFGTIFNTVSLAVPLSGHLRRKL